MCFDSINSRKVIAIPMSDPRIRLMWTQIVCQSLTLGLNTNSADVIGEHLITVSDYSLSIIRFIERRIDGIRDVLHRK